MTLTPIDYIFLILIVFFALNGILKGFVANIFGKLSWILGLVMAFMLYDDVAKCFSNQITNDFFRLVIAFFLVFILVFLIVKIFGTICERIVTLPILKSLDRTLGCILGIFEGFVIAGLILFLLSVQPFFDCQNMLNSSFFFDFLKNFIGE